MLATVYSMVILLAGLLLTGEASQLLYVKAQSAQLHNAQVSQVLQSARDQLLGSIQSQVQSGKTPSQLAAPTYAPISLCPTAQSCPLSASATFVQSGASGAANNGTAVTAYNTNATLNEGRASWDVTATVVRSGVAIATRTQRITYATFTQAPWGQEADALDASGAASVPNQGDRFGCDPANSSGSCINPSDVSQATPADTRTHVNPQCTGDPTECYWAAQDTYHPADNFQPVTWTSTDANP
jgi:hypothetical protein